MSRTWGRYQDAVYTLCTPTGRGELSCAGAEFWMSPVPSQLGM